VFGSRTAAGVDRVVEQRDWGTNLARELARADLTLRPSEYIAIRIAAFIGAPIVVFLIGRTAVPTLNNGIALIAAAALGWWIPRFWVNHRKGKRLNAFNDHLADTITLIANALRAGASFLQAIELVVRESQPPISTEFNRVIREVNLGLPFEQALANMVRRVESDDLELMTTAITIQHQVGGNLAEILDSIAFTIRERIRIKGEIKTLTAQQRLSGYVVAGLPIFLVGTLMVIAPTFMEPMFTKPPAILDIPLGTVILGAGGVMMFFGFMAIRKIVDIEV
jgi:tight adherence protein B